MTAESTNHLTASRKRVVIAGAGLRGRLFADVLRREPDVEVAAFLENDEATVANLSTTTSAPVYSSLSAALTGERDRIDAVMVATPDFAHRELVLDSAAAGLDLFIEKPLAMNIEDAGAMSEAIRRHEVRSMVGFENRWSPHVISARDAIDSGQIGSPVSISVTMSNSYFVPLRMLKWANRSSPIWFLMPHTVDLASYLLDSIPVSVVAVGSRGVLTSKGIDTWDVVHCLLRFGNGTTASLTSSWILPESQDTLSVYTFDLLGEKGAVRGTPNRQGLSIISDKQREVQPYSGFVEGVHLAPSAWMVREFAHRLVSNTAFEPNAAHGLLVTQVLNAIEVSLATGRQVDIADSEAQ